MLLWSEGFASSGEEIHFHTKSGLLKAARKDSWIELDFPAKPPTETSPPPGLLDALGTSARYVGRNQFDFLVELESEDEVRGLAPNFARLSTLDVRGVIVTSRSSTPQYDFVSRFFAPRAGVDEDPVTGSAHCCLGPYWQGRLGKSDFTAFQASARGGVVRVRIVGDRNFLGGQAITVCRGELVA